MKLADMIKLSVSRLLLFTGIVGPAKRQYTDRFLILMYHRILAQQGTEPPYFRESMFISPEAFEMQLKYLTERANVRPLRETLLKIEKKEAFDPSTVVITFDDGYLDNYITAFPLLKKYGATATIFLTTGPLDTGNPLYWDRSASMILSLWDSKGIDAFMDSPLRKYTVGMEKASKNQFTKYVMNETDKLRRVEREKLWSDFNEWIKSETLPKPENPMMTWEMVREMAAYGVEFENHTINHDVLDELSLAELKKETLPACYRIQEMVHQPADIFDYPRGKTLSGNQDEFIRKYFSAAVGTVSGFNTYATDKYRLYRKDANFLLVNKTFYPAYFEAELGGFWDRLRRVKNMIAISD